MYKVNSVLAALVLILMTSCSKELFKNNPLGNNPIELSDNNFRNSTHCDYSPCLGEGEIAISNIPVIISDYIETNYSNYKIKEAEVLGCNIIENENENEQEGNFNNDHSDMFTGPVEDIDFFVIELNKDLELLFDASGNFIAEQNEQDGNFENENENEHNIMLEDLSDSVKNYMETNYPEESIMEASLETEFGFEFIELETENREVVFDSNGEFICEEN